LLTLRAGLCSLRNDRVVELRLFDGFVDTARVLADSLGDDVPAAVMRLARDLDSAYDARPATVVAARRWLDRVSAAIAAADASIAGGPNAGEAPALSSEPRAWIEALAMQCRGAQDELTRFAPWLLAPGCEELLAEFPILAPIPTLHGLANLMPALAPQIDRLRSAAASDARRERLDEVALLAETASARAKERIEAIERMASQCEGLARMEAGFLYDATRHLFAVGYNVDERQRDPSYYDLLASEARLASFVAIAQGRVPQESWFALGRLLTSAGDRPALVSWSGSMFEYLMPLLVMPTYENTLLDETCRAAVERQIAYGKQIGVPWGMSESGYNAVDANLNYQYRAFGVPGLGLKRGLAEDVVVAPYASMLALMVAPEAACLNLQRLAAEGLAGRFGLFEAIDYTPARLPRGQASAVVRSFMAHHQ
ncbi:MAG TPA: glucoamylase family protein, partial [Usitatibacter sp.]